MVRLMRDAVRLDPQFVLAWDSLASSLWSRASQIGDIQPDQAGSCGPRRSKPGVAWRSWRRTAGSCSCKRSDDLLRAEKWSESEAVARQLLEAGPFSFERAQPLINVLFCHGPHR